MMQLAAAVLAVTLLNPVRTYFQPNAPVMINLDAAALAKATDGDKAPLKLVLLTPAGQPAGEAAIDRDKPQFDLAALFPGGQGKASLWDGKTYYVQLVLGDKPVGSPLAVVPLRSPGDPRSKSPDALRIEPERLVEFDTTQGKIIARMDPAAAPNTVMHFQMLVAGGFYTNIKFHRVLPQFVIQGGDPLGNGTGGPGYYLGLEASNKPHVRGTLSMARLSQPVDSAGSQFFICLTKERCAALDRQYAAFGDVVSGMDVVEKIAAMPLADAEAGRPVTPVTIQEGKLLPAPPRPIGQAPPPAIAEPK